MMPEPETHHHHHHVTGLKWFDLILPISALFVSIVSLALAVIHGRAMEKMANANAQLVQANSWPFLQFGFSNATPTFERELQLEIVNNGVGPAKIETFEVFWKGQPVRNGRDLFKACCGLQPGEIPETKNLSLAARAALGKPGLKNGLIKSTVPGRVLEPRERIQFMRLPLTDTNSRVFFALNDNSDGVSVRICYCSVFDECWLSDGRTMKPTKVAVCSKPKVQYN
jgi:hypothetical protein